MATRDVVEGYLRCLKQGKGWESFLADAMTFTSFTSPPRRVEGKAAYLEATRRFYSMVKAVEVNGVLVEGDEACALTHYELQPPQGGVPAFTSDVAEIFGVRDGKIESFDIYFDSAPFPR